MRFFAVTLSLVFLFASSTGFALERETGTVARTATEPDRSEQLDNLFEKLRNSADPEAAKSAENSIVRLWLESGSPTVDLLMAWTITAVGEKDYSLALDYLDRIILLKPDFPEAWNKRATVHFLAGNYPRALADIERTLVLEPRHFGALSGLGAIMQEIGEKQRAVSTYQKVLEIAPHLDAVRKALDNLNEEAGGHGI